MPERPPISEGYWRASEQGVVKGVPRGELSKTLTETVLRISNSEETMTVPVQVSTTVWDLKQILAATLDIEPSGTMQFLMKQGCYWRQQQDSEEIGRKVVVRGIKSFKRARLQYKHPFVVIGAGHIGLRQAMWFLKYQEYNFVVFERRPEVGGMAWFEQANSTSKLQTELGVYHMNYDETLAPPTNDYPWPSRDDLLAHFKWAAEEFGLYPYIRLNTNVKRTLTEKAPAGGNKWDSTYELTLEKVGDTSEAEETFHSSSIFLYPGNLSVARREDYPGEDDFGGIIAYGMFDSIDYRDLTGKNVAIVGHGAFAVENVRTCMEYDAGQLYLVCRRKNISCPRFTSWLCNQSVTPLQGALFLKSMEPMYSLAGFDVWSYYAIHASASRQIVTIEQKVRFGIGDVYFLAISWGKLEVIVDPVCVKRVTRGVLHTAGGRKLEVGAILKLLGFVGQPDNDRLMNVKELLGFWVNGDPKTYLVAEPVSVAATQFSSTSFSPGAMGWVSMGMWFLHYPSDFYKVAATGLLPKHKADGDRPAYVVDARHGSQTAIFVISMIPWLSNRGAVEAELKNSRMWLLHPIDKFLDYCKEDWDHYCRKLTNEGYSGPEYPYTKEVAHSLLDEYRVQMEKALSKMTTK